MNCRPLKLVVFVLIGISHGSAWAWPVRKHEIDYENQNYKQWWGGYLVWHFDSLPKRGAVPADRMPYAGYMYPDNQGGTADVLIKYDRAFHRGEPRATNFEYRDIRMRGAPYWAGHCNGWAAAAIRHAEPRENVVRNGVVFTPADIKGLLAELYVHSETEFLGGMDAAINPGMFHVTVTNWIGRGQHPIGMDHTVGYEAWNYPIYAYAYDSAKRGERKVEVRINIGYVDMVEREHNRAPRDKVLFMHLHYLLDLTEDGEVIGGEYYKDSKRVDMLWAPLKPTQGGSKGNEDGNPHLNAKEVLGIWRESAPEDLRGKWWNIDPTEEDAITENDDQLMGVSATAEMR